MSAHLLSASSGIVLALCTAVPGRSFAADEALLMERHVVTGWNIHSLTVSCDTYHTLCTINHVWHPCVGIN